MKDEFRIAVKALIAMDNKILLIKRRPDDPHKPGVWEYPGGRLEPGEDPLKGLAREVKEETGLDIEVLNPLKVMQFQRDDGQNITMITFYCKPTSEKTELSHEHTNEEWIDIDKAQKIIFPGFREEIEIYKEYFMK